MLPEQYARDRNLPIDTTGDKVSINYEIPETDTTNLYLGHIMIYLCTADQLQIIYRSSTYHLVPRLLLREAVQDLSVVHTDLTQETCAVVDHADCTGGSYPETRGKSCKTENI